jgi:hypothetical protein
MPNPLEYLIENISWYAPIYNIAWVLFMVYALTLPPLLLLVFHKVPALRKIQPPRDWAFHRKTFPYLIGAAFVIFSFRLIPYWIFNDKILHFLGGGIAIALIYEYFVLNLSIREGGGLFSLKHVADKSRLLSGESHPAGLLLLLLQRFLRAIRIRLQICGRL